MITMAITHFRSQIIGKGRSPVAAAAYRHRTRMHDASLELSWRFDAKADDLGHAELNLPHDAPPWMIDLLHDRTPATASEALWNAVAGSECRADAQTAREIVIALPIELSLSQNIVLARDYIETNLVTRGFVADWVLHNNPGNPHLHIMHTIRPLAPDGFGLKRSPVYEAGGNRRVDASGRVIYKPFMGFKEDLGHLRNAWGEAANAHYAAAGMDIRIDMRSYADRGIGLTPTLHNGSKINGALRRGELVFRTDKDAAAHRERVAAVRENSIAVLDLVTEQQSTFTQKDLAKIVHRHVPDEDFAHVFERARNHTSLILLKPDGEVDPLSQERTDAVYTTRAMIDLEHDMAINAAHMRQTSGFKVAARDVESAISATETADIARPLSFSDEQRHALCYVTGPEQIANIVGLAGTGKTTLLDAARRAWESNGAKVYGVALAGKAAKGLQQSAGIEAHTIRWYEIAWANGRYLPARGDVILIDEAGMASSAQIANMIKITLTQGAKLVLVGDPDQLQPINAGAAFRTLLEEIGFAELAEIRRQREDWQRDATRAFARNDVATGIAAYRKHGDLITTETKDQAIEQLVEEWRRLVLLCPDIATAKDVIVVTHRNDDVQTLNAILRSIVKDAGQLHDEISYQTASGPRKFATGDRVLMLKNAAVTGESGLVKIENGTLGTVTATANGSLSVTLDDGTRARLNAGAYRDIDHGYATTIHKSQGVTVNTTLALVTPGMDRHATYVAFSRHRHTLKIFAPQEGFCGSLEATIGRNSAKSTTRDYRHTDAYRDAFAMRRGLDNPSLYVAVRHAALRAQRAALDALWSAAQTALRAFQQRYARATAHTTRSDEPHARGTPNRSQTAATVNLDTKGRAMSETATTTNQQSQPLKFDYSVEGNEARITFGYSKEANVMLGQALKPESIAFKDGAWTTPLSDDVNKREIQLTKINIAATRIGAHFAEVNQNQTHANRIAGDDQLMSADVKLSVRNRTLAVQIPAVRSAIDALKATGATYVAKNGENGNYWRVPTPTAEAADTASNAIMTAANLIQEEKKTIGLTQSVTTTHDEMLVSRANDKVWVDIPNMAGANAILKADGPAAATWDRSAGAWAMPVNSSTIDDVNGRLAKVADYFDNAMLQPHKGRPGLDYNANDIDAIKMYTPQEYANEPKIRGYVDSVVRDIDRAITPGEKKILLEAAPGAAVHHERFDKSHGVPAVQELVRLTQNIQNQGMKQVLANEQAQAQSKTQSQGIGQ